MPVKESNNGREWIIRVVIALAGFLAGGGSFALAVKGDIAEAEKQTAIVSERVTGVDARVDVVNADIRDIKVGLKDLNAKVDIILREIRP